MFLWSCDDEVTSLYFVWESSCGLPSIMAMGSHSVWEGRGAWQPFWRVMRESKAQKEVMVGIMLDLPGPLCYWTSCRFNCILYMRPNPTGSDKCVKHKGPVK